MKFQIFTFTEQKEKTRVLKLVFIFKTTICLLIYNVYYSIITALRVMQVKKNQAWVKF